MLGHLWKDETWNHQVGSRFPLTKPPSKWVAVWLLHGDLPCQNNPDFFSTNKSIWVDVFENIFFSFNWILVPHPKGLIHRYTPKNPTTTAPAVSSSKDSSRALFFVPNLLVLLALWLWIPIPYSLGEYNFKLLSWKPSFLEVFLIAKTVPQNISAYGRPNFSLGSQQETTFAISNIPTQTIPPKKKLTNVPPQKRGGLYIFNRKYCTSSSSPISQGLSPHHPHPKERQVRYAALRPSPCGIPHPPSHRMGSFLRLI